VLLSIDPGVTHLGWAKMDPATKEVLEAGTYKLSDLADVKGNDSKLAMLIGRFFDTFPFMKYVAVEQNTEIRVMQIVEGVCLGYWRARGAQVYHVSPLTLKAHYSRLGVRSGSAKRTKTDAMNECRAMGYPDFKGDHEADAILIGRYCIDTKMKA